MNQINRKNGNEIKKQLKARSEEKDGKIRRSGDRMEKVQMGW